jgi:hypothetical protein
MLLWRFHEWKSGNMKIRRSPNSAAGELDRPVESTHCHDFKPSALIG